MNTEGPMAAPVRKDEVDAIPDLMASADNSFSSDIQNSNAMEIENSSPVQELSQSEHLSETVAQGSVPMPDTSEIIEESYFEEEVHILLDESGQDSQNVVTYTTQIIEIVEQEVTESEANDDFIGDFLEEVVEEEVTESEIIEEEVTESEPNEFIGDFIEEKLVIDVDELIARNNQGDSGSDHSELARINASVAIPGEKAKAVDSNNEDEKNYDNHISSENIPPGRDIATCNEKEIADRLYGAMRHALDALDQHYPNAFLEPNPSLIDTTSTAVAERPPREELSSDLEWAVRKTVDVIYPEPFCVPELQNLPNELDLENDQNMQLSLPTRAIQKSTEDKLKEEKKDSDDDDDDDEVPFDEVGPIPQKSLTTDEKKCLALQEQNQITTSSQESGTIADLVSESTDLTPQQQNQIAINSQEPETTSDITRERASPPSDVSAKTPSDGSSCTPQISGEEEDLESNNNLDGSSIASNQMPSLSSTTASMEEEREQEQKVENIMPPDSPISDTTEQKEQPLPPNVLSQLQRKQQTFPPTQMACNHSYTQNDRDLEAQRESKSSQAVHKAKQPSNDVDGVFTLGSLEREREKEIAKFENIKRTLRVVLLTLLVTVPFAVGAFLTLRKEADDDD